MLKITLSPQWSIRHPTLGSLSPKVIELLMAVSSHGTVSGACVYLGLSYRHAWQMLRDGEAMLGHPLISMVRGKGSDLTHLGQRLVWAQRRAQARLSPMLEALSSELEAEMTKAVEPTATFLRIHASQSSALDALRPLLSRAGLAHQLRYCDGAEALSSLNNGRCDVAGIHFPIGEFEPDAIGRHGSLLNGTSQKLIRVATRRQGFIVAPGNPKKIYDIEDLGREGVRFVNRQLGSGTRSLFDLMLSRSQLKPEAIHGYEHCEFTHAAIAAFVASGMADVGFGVEVFAREFKLEFIPCEQERYFLLFNERGESDCGLLKLIELLKGDDYRSAIDRLPGYSADHSGTVVGLNEVFSTLKAPSERRPARSSTPRLSSQGQPA